jgi:tetratricopeptide (TPR) repeat protein
LFFSWYNLGSNLTALGDYPAAAQAYDRAFAEYAAIPEDDRPWRMLWYQAAPYEAYFNTGRFEDVITLGNQALNSANGPLLEETFYWLGRAREATGDMEKALYDYRRAVEINPASTPAKQELERLGYTN